jgi:hypothetical protein
MIAQQCLRYSNALFFVLYFIFAWFAVNEISNLGFVSISQENIYDYWGIALPLALCDEWFYSTSNESYSISVGYSQVTASESGELFTVVGITDPSSEDVSIQLQKVEVDGSLAYSMPLYAQPLSSSFSSVHLNTKKLSTSVYGENKLYFEVMPHEASGTIIVLQIGSFNASAAVANASSASKLTIFSSVSVLHSSNGSCAWGMDTGAGSPSALPLLGPCATSIGSDGTDFQAYKVLVSQLVSVSSSDPTICFSQVFLLGHSLVGDAHLRGYKLQYSCPETVGAMTPQLIASWDTILTDSIPDWSDPIAASSLSLQLWEDMILFVSYQAASLVPFPDTTGDPNPLYSEVIAFNISSSPASIMWRLTTDLSLAYSVLAVVSQPIISPTGLLYVSVITNYSVVSPDGSGVYSPAIACIDAFAGALIWISVPPPLLDIQVIPSYSLLQPMQLTLTQSVLIFCGLRPIPNTSTGLVDDSLIGMGALEVGSGTLVCISDDSCIMIHWPK